VEVVAHPNGITTTSKLEGLPELGFDMLPEKMREWARNLSESQQVPASMTVLSCIATASACLAGKWQVAPVTHNWPTETTSLNTLIIAKSSGGKSRVFSKVTQPIEKWERQKRSELLPERLEALARVEEAETHQERIEALGEVPVVPDMRVVDTTPAKLAMRMAAHYGRVAVLSSEGGPLKDLSGKKFNTPPEFELWKKAWTSEYHREDRVGAGTREVHQPVITFLLMAQPAILDALDACPSLKGEGLWNRFMFLLLADNRANLKPSHEAPELDQQITAEWEKVCFRLLDAEHKGTVPHTNQDGDRVQQVPILWDLALTPGAEEVRRKFEASILREIQDGHRLDSVAEWAQKATGMALRIGGVLHLVQRAYEGIEGAELFRTEISEASMEMAVQIVDVLSDHFIHAMEERSHFDPVMYVYDKLLSVGWGASRRELKRKCPRLKNVDELKPILAELEDRGLITEVMVEGKNGHWAPHYFNPDEYTPELERAAIQNQ